MDKTPRDASQTFARQLDRFRPWLGYVLVWTILVGFSPLGLYLLGRIDLVLEAIGLALLALIPAVWALLQAGRCPVCRHILPGVSQTCAHCGSRLR